MISSLTEILKVSKLGGAWSSKYSWAVLAVLALLFISTSFGPDISNWTEGLYAGAVREMYARGDWLNPTNNGFLRIEKPPLVYWFLLGSTSLFGLNEFGLRLPVSLAISCWVAIIFLIMRRLGGNRLGIASALILSTMIGTRVFAEILQPEPFMALFSTGALWCMVESRFAFLARTSDSRGIYSKTFFSGWYWLFWVFLALGTLSKGLHGALWPLGAVILTGTFFPSTRTWLRGAANLTGFGIFLVIVLPWYVYMVLHWPGFLTEHFWNEQIRTAASIRIPQYNLKVPLFASLLHQLIATLPWSLALPGAVWIALKRKSELQGPVRDAVRLLVVTFLLEAVSLTFSSRFTYYGVSTWGWVAGFLALPWCDDFFRSRWIPRICLLLPGLMVLGAAAIYLGMAVIYVVYFPVPPLSGIRDSELTSIFVLSPKLFSSPSLVTGFLGSILLAGGIAIAWFWYLNRPFSILVATSLSMLAPFLFVTLALNKISPFFSLAQAAQIVNQQIVSKANALVVAMGDPDACSSLFLYLHVQPRYLDAQFNREYAQRVLGLGRDFYLKEDDFVRLWHSSRAVYLIMQGQQWKYWQANGLLSDHLRKIYDAGNYVVVTNS